MFSPSALSRELRKSWLLKFGGKGWYMECLASED